MSLDTRNPRRLPAHRRRELEIARADLEAALLGARRYCFVQSNLAVPNEAGASYRGDVNTALQACATFESGASAPGTTYADQYWYDTTTNTLKKRNQANSAWFVIGTRDEAFVVTRSSNTILGLSDYGKMFAATGTFTQTLTAAATLGDGWFCFYRNDGTGVITLDPNASETIEGSTTVSLQPGEMIRIACDGTQFRTNRQGAWPQTTGAAPTPGSGAFTSVTYKYRFSQNGKTVNFRAEIDIVTIGTASGNMTINLPVNASNAAVGSNNQQVLFGYDFNANLGIFAELNVGTALVSRIGGTNSIAANATIVIQGTYEAA